MISLDSSREIYWNVGHGVIAPMYLFVLLALGILVYGFYSRLKVYRLGAPLGRLDNLPSRLLDFLKNAFTQIKVVRETGAGIPHALFFWSFILLFIGTTLIFIQEDITAPIFDIHFLRGGFYKLFSLVLDIAGAVAIVALLRLFLRRYFIRPEGLVTSGADILTAGLLFAILITGFVVEGLRISATELALNADLAWFSPVGLVIGKMFSGLSEQSLRNIHFYLWWAHFAIVIGFFVSIPFTKLRHLFLTPVNYIFADRGRRGKLVTINLEDESREIFGVSKVSEFTWKDIFDSDACTLCKRCQDQCPAYATGKPLSPMKVINQICDTAFHSPSTNLIETVTQDALWSCTTCGACQEICPASIEHVNKIVDMRRNLALMDGQFPGDEVQKAMEAVEVNGNPLNMAFASRADWADGLASVTISGSAQILYFAGCYASFDKRNIKVARSFIKICESAGVTVRILGKDEKCCGEPMRKLGNEYLYQELAKENIERIKSSGAQTIVTTCPHCFNTLGGDYKDLGLEIEVLHHTVFINRLIDDGRLKIKADEFDCSYHDSCYIGRYNDIFDEPRGLLKKAGGKITEMDKNRYESFCCGGGGGRILAEEKLGTRISAARVNMAKQTGAPKLISNCPFCLTMFEDAVKSDESGGDLEPMDIAELLARIIHEVS